MKPSVYRVPPNSPDLPMELRALIVSNVLRPGDLLIYAPDGTLKTERRFGDGDQADIESVLPFLVHVSGPRLRKFRREK